MQTAPSSREAVLGALTSLPLMAVGYLGQRIASLPSPHFTLFDWLSPRRSDGDPHLQNQDLTPPRAFK